MAMKILVVDDDIMNLKIAQFVLEKDNYDVTTASSGEEALSLLKEGAFALLLLDIEMPVMNGYEVLESLGQRSIPVVILSGDIEHIDTDRLEALGVREILEKPFLPTSLLQSINKAVHDAL